MVTRIFSNPPSSGLPSPPGPASGLDGLAGGGEAGALLRALDWTRTPLGPPSRWPQSLRTAVRLLLGSRYAMFIWWGREFTNIYNDAYRPILGKKHPAMGVPARAVWSEIWHDVGPRAEAVLLRGESTFDEQLPLWMERHGFVEETYFTFSYSPLPDDDGGIGGVFCAVTEDTQRVIGERRLALLRDLAACTSEARGDLDACAAAAACLGEDPRDLPFTAIYLLDPDGASARRAAASGRPEDVRALPDTLDPRAPFGPHPPAGIAAVPIPQPGQPTPAGILVAGLTPHRPYDEAFQGFVKRIAGQIGAAVANARAYEEERRRAESLAELDRAKTTFFSNVSHELRTPLTLLLGPLSDVAALPSLPPEARELTALAHRSALRLLKLVNTLLDFARIEAGRVQASYEPTDLAALTAELASGFRSAAERGGLSLAVDCPPLPEPACVDRDMWEKIVLNLLSNALKFTFSGEIRVALRADGGAAELTVSDTGVGIPEAELPHVFDRFRRVEGARGRTHEGTGIGLALVHEFTRLHGGTVRARSAEGQGSAFTVRIPLGTAHLPQDRLGAPRSLAPTGIGAAPFVEETLRWLPDTAPREASDPGRCPSPLPAPAPASTSRILIADDNADMRAYLRRLLAPRYAVEVVEDGEAAMAAVRRSMPHLVLSDVMMPRLDGFGLLRALRADPATRPLPVILISARAGEESRLEGLDGGADDYLVKPFSGRELLARVEAHLRLAGLRRDAAQAVHASEERLRLLLDSERAARAEAERANRLKDDFLAVVSHELRTPLNAILGWTQMLRRGTLPAASAARALEVIERNTQVQTQLIADLLDVSRIISGKLTLDLARADLGLAIESAADAVRQAAASKEIRIDRAIDPAAAWVLGDPARLQQVIWNLLSNAVKFSPRGGRVRVSLTRRRGFAEVRVQDEGQGIRPEFLPHVFERFRQADSSAARHHGGLGLGLSIVKHLVDAHGGRVRAKSDGDGHGATFVVELPLAPEAELGRPWSPGWLGGERPSGELLAGLRVLVVEDEVDSRDLIERVLAEAGAEVRTAASTAEALAMLAQGAPDILVSDLGMPGEDGFELIRKARSGALGKAIPAVAVTAFARAEDRERAIAAGFDAHVAKPLDFQELLGAMARLCGRGADMPGGDGGGRGPSR